MRQSCCRKNVDLQTFSVWYPNYRQPHMLPLSVLIALRVLPHCRPETPSASPLHCCGDLLAAFCRDVPSAPPSLAMALDNLAGCYLAEAKYADAESLYRRSLQIYKNSWGTKHPAAANARRRFIELLRATNRREEADKIGEADK